MYLETVIVTGMNCEHCVDSLTEEIEQLDGVSVMEIDLVSGLVTFVSEEPVDPYDLAEVVEVCGYRLLVPARS
ncbi:MAG TPA: heavy metal-associated domain-containing protein [Pseudonocardia sp.]|nr:heavy metal-associated domain-containing protein [Pseudonocardia sp.]